MNPKVRKVLEIVKNVVVWLVIITAIVMTIFTVFTVAFVDKNDRTFFGLRMMIVLTGSMRTEFPEGDLIFTVEEDPKNLKIGDVITYETDEINGNGNALELVTHKIVAINKNEKGQLDSFTTAGTTTGAEDVEPVLPNQVVGKHVFTIPKLGYFFEFMKTTPGYICCILIPFLLIIGYQGVNCVMLFRKYRSEQVSEMRLERERLEEERAESQRMMQELLALKAQLEQNQTTGQTPSTPSESEQE